MPGVACWPWISTPKRARPTGGQLSGRCLKLEVGAELIWPVIAAGTTLGAAATGVGAGSLCGAAVITLGAGSICGAAANCCGAGSVVFLGAAPGKLLERRAATAAAAAAAAADFGLLAGAALPALACAPGALACAPSALACALAIAAAMSGVIMERSTKE